MTATTVVFCPLLSRSSLSSWLLPFFTLLLLIANKQLPRYCVATDLCWNRHVTDGLHPVTGITRAVDLWHLRHTFILWHTLG